MESDKLKAEAILLILVVLIFGAVVVIQTLKTGSAPAWFETSVVPIVVATLMSLKLGVEKTFVLKLEDKDDETEEKDEHSSQ